MERIDIDKNVDALDFGSPFEIRIQMLCHAHEMVSIRDLCRYSRLDLMKMRHCGRKTIGRMEAVLNRYGLQLGMTDRELTEYAHTAQRERTALAAASALEETEDTEAAKWEQRRYEIAREMFVQHRMLAVAAVKEADDLIAALGYRQHA